MTKMMKALVKTKAEPGLTLKEIPIPEYGHNDLLIKVTHTAICGTDLHIYKWDEWSQKTIKPPMTIGHEFVGTIVKIGSEVRGFNIGERVSAEGHLTCGLCRSCRAGKAHLCTHTVGIGVNRDGCFAEYISVPAKNAVHIKDDISSEMASIFDPFGNATHTALSFDLVGEDVLITGAGPIGIMAVAICKFAGARNVVITDVQDYRLDLARKMGATRAININKTTLADTMKDLNMIAFDVGLEMSGNSQAFTSMIQNLHHGGKIALLGILPSKTEIPWNDVIFKGLIIKGIYGREIFETWYKMQAMLQSGLNIAPIITHKFKFDDFEKGFEVMLKGECGKVVLEF